LKIINSCPLCSSKSSSTFYEFGSPNKMRVNNRICTDCGLVFLSPRPDFEELKQYYGNYVKQTQSEIAEIPISFEEHILGISRLRLQYLQKYIRDGMKILDIGCSFGAMLKVLRDESGFNIEVTGVNPEHSLVKFGKHEYGLDIRAGMFEEQNFPSGSFDLIILDNVLEHFDDPMQSVKDIHALLSERGKLFIATNNLDTPHGFLWQNFFPDHTVTFSPKTLKALLESQGFNIINQEMRGHITHEGYHYPYQYCMAEKTEYPSEYDFYQYAEDATEKILQVQKYIDHYFSTDRLAKKIYELNLEEKSGLLVKTKAVAYNLLARLTNSSIEFQIMNHTLPPEEFYYRRLLIAECTTEADLLQAFDQARESGLNPLVFIIRKNESGGILLQHYPAQFTTSSPPSVFSDRAEFIDWLFNNSPQIYECIFMHFNNADVPVDSLKRSYKIFRKKENDYYLVDYRPFTSAWWEFFRKDALDKIRTDKISEYRAIEESTDVVKHVIWPQKKDYHYFLKEKFQNYFKTPKVLSLDLSPFCNKKCDKCQFHSSRSPFASTVRAGKFMPVDFAFKILDQAKDWSPQPTFAPTYSGEPFVYPHLHNVLKYAKKLNYSISITTNGLALNEQESRFLVNSGIDTLVFSVDAFNEETYSLLQPPGSLSKVKENIIRFLEMRGSSQKPLVGVHYVMEARNKHEFKDYLNFWGKKVDFVSTAIHQDQFAACQCSLPLWFSLGQRQACWSAWNNIYIRWNGDISFCGFDIESKSSKLNAHTRSLLDIWNSEEFWRWREAQLTNDRSILYCKACPDWSGLRTVRLKDKHWHISRTPLTETYTHV
jgi:MoaA/NifB/PqqE/SkfB family radical SAM enzyme/SAM-dependent methyltransferase